MIFDLTVEYWSFRPLINLMTWSPSLYPWNLVIAWQEISQVHLGIERNFFQFSPQFLEFCIVRKDRIIILLQGENFFLNVWNSKNILIKMIPQIIQHFSCAFNPQNALSNFWFNRIADPWHNHGVASIPNSKKLWSLSGGRGKTPKKSNNLWEVYSHLVDGWLLGLIYHDRIVRIYNHQIRVETSQRTN